MKVVWPHRWEHDKGPDELLRVAGEYSERLNLRWTILGERFGEMPREMVEFERRFARRIDHMGYVDSRDEYWRLLRGCDWVLSTARHEFFGIAVVEALMAGCLPWLPGRLSYPELLASVWVHGDEVRDGSGGEWLGECWPGAPPVDADEMRRRVWEHLQPALAVNAAGRLDDAIDRLVAARV